MGQAAEDALGPGGNLGRGELLRTQVQTAGQRRVDHRNVRLVLVLVGDRDDLGLRVAQQDLDQLQGRVARGANDGNACHDSRSYS